MKIIFGLGNPGFWYRNTRHNIGFDICKTFVKTYNGKINRKKFLCKYWIGKIEKEDILVALPQTYMNNSGDAVKAIVEEFSVKTEDILVVVDDFHIPLGKIRLRKKGSSGGHNGLASIENNIGENYCRLRIGIGPKPSDKDIIKFVLGTWSKTEKKIIKKIINEASAVVGTYITKGIEVAMSKHN